MRARRCLPSLSDLPFFVGNSVRNILFCTIVAVIYRYCWIDAQDPYKCGALLNEGSWLDAGDLWSSPRPYQNWQPPGCIMYEYKHNEIADCLRGRRLVFIGDSTTRQVFWATARKLDEDRAEREMTKLLESTEKHIDIEFISWGVTAQFIWDPYLNGTGLQRELEAFRSVVTTPDGNREDKGRGSASLLLLGAPGLWYARHGDENHFKLFKQTIDYIIPFMQDRTTPNSQKPSQSFSEKLQSSNFLFMAPVLAPWYETLSPSRAESILPEKIDRMNDYLHQLTENQDADVIWSFAEMMEGERNTYEESGLHVLDNVASRKADVLLNLRCNAKAAQESFPYSRTCCSNYRKPYWLQWLVLFGGLSALPLIFFVKRRQSMRGRLSVPKFLRPLTILVLVICFCFYADRTQIFEKAQKQFRLHEFLGACFAMAIIGLVAIQRGDGGQQSKGKGPQQAFDKGFLSREQSEEWKGWMQAVILIYHYTGASKVLWIYEIIRLLVASYLFMSAWGHTYFFLKRQDFSLSRVASVLTRLNLLTCSLSYMMRTDYPFYYFAPLVSFWFLVIYFTLGFKYERNNGLGFLLTKIIISACLVSFLVLTPCIVESVFNVLKLVSGMNWSASEFRFRISLDLFIVPLGMLLASLHHRSVALANNTPAITHLDDLLSFINEIWGFFRVSLIILSICLPPAWWALISRSPDKYDYNWWHPWISSIPILSFLVLRNSHRHLRNIHSRSFAWLGRISLETFILQYHVWLAGDSKGLLSLGFGRSYDFIIITPIFLWVAWCTAYATRQLSDLFVPREEERGRLRPEYDLPSAREETTPSKDHGFASLGLVERSVRALKEDLRLRLVFAAGVLWLFNLIGS